MPCSGSFPFASFKQWIPAVLLAVLLMVRPQTALAQRPYGIDVSNHQGPGLNWVNIKSSGISFTWAKATEGTSFSDADFTINEQNAVSAGVLIGGYHYARYDLNTGTAGAVAEANWFWQKASAYINTNGGYLMPMLDVEQSPGSSYTKTTLSQWVNTWCQTVTNLAWSNGVVVTPVIYASSSFTSTWFDNTVAQWIPWIAAWSSSANPQTGGPSGTGPWGSWLVWQYNDTNTMFSGPPKTCDVDVFNGTLTSLTNTLIVGKALPWPAAGVTNFWDPGFVNAAPGTGGSGTWNISNTNWWHSGLGDVGWSMAGDYAVFAGTSGTVTLGSSVGANGITFSNGGYVINGSSTLTMNSPATISLPPATTNSIQCVFGGTAFTLSGGGTLYLNNAGNYSSGETVTGPNTTLQVANLHDTGNTGVTLTLKSGGIFQNLDATSGDQFLLSGCTISLSTGGGVLENPKGNLTLTNKITGSGSLTYIGTSFTLTMTNPANTYSGGTIVQSGTLKVGVAGTLGSTSGALTVNGGTLDLGTASHTSGTVTIAGGKIQNGTLTAGTYNGQSGTVSAVLAGLRLNKTTSGTLTLSGANTYTGGTTISAGTLALAASGSINQTPSISIAAGGTLDVSAIPAYALSSSSSLIASGNTSPATINGASSGTVNLGSRPISLTYDGANPALTIAQGQLVLNGNSFSVGGSALPLGTYTLIQQASGNIAASGNFTVSGPVIGAGEGGSISIDGGNVNLIIKTLPVFANLTVPASINYGQAGILTLSGNLSANGPIYPAPGETVTVTINGIAQNTTINDSTGDFSINFNLPVMPVGTYTITYSYVGDATLSAAANATTSFSILPLPAILTGARPYDATANAAASILSVKNKVGSDIVTVASGIATLGSTNVGTQPISSIGSLALGGLAAGNYTMIGAVGSVTITAPPFSISSATVDSTGTNFIITWQSAPGATYQVLGTTTLNDDLTSWTNVGPSILATNTVTSATIPITPPMGFFNVSAH